MATLNFPTNPALNQTYTFGTKTWIWNGQGWQLDSTGAINNIPIGNTTPAAGTFTVVTAVGNVVGQYFIGNGSQLSGISANYSNANVAAYLPFYTGNLPNLTGSVTTTGNLRGGNIATVGKISATGNVAGNYFIGNGSQLTGIVAEAGAAITNGDSNVRIDGANADVTVGVDGVPNVAVFTTQGVSVTGNIIPSANGVYSIGNSTNWWANVWLSGNTLYLGGVPLGMSAGNVLTVDGQDVLSSNTTASISTTGNVTADNFIGNGTQLTGVMADRGPDPNNWNTLIEMGVYTVNRVSWSGTVGTPLDSQVFVGLLEVKNSTDTAIEQIFFPGTVEENNQKIQWNRAQWNGSWTGWIKVVNDYQIVIGGEF